jgi:hypothetical protein
MEGAYFARFLDCFPLSFVLLFGSFLPAIARRPAGRAVVLCIEPGGASLALPLVGFHP